MPAEILEVSDHFVTSPLGKLFAREWRPAQMHDDRAPIVLVHDSLGCVELWRNLPSLLAVRTGRAIIAYDRLGFGSSDPYPGKLSADFVADEARTYLPTLLNGLGIGKVVLLGHSVGGAMAAVFAAALGDRCAALITESAQTFTEDVTLAGIRAAKVSFAEPGQIGRLERYHGAKARWVLDAWVETWLSQAFASWDIGSNLRKIRSPILAIHGDNDEFGSLIHPKRIAELAPGGAVTCIIEECGHVPHREKPDLVLQTVAEFLARAG